MYHILPFDVRLLFAPVCVIQGGLVQYQAKEMCLCARLVGHRGTTTTIQVSHFYQTRAPVRPVHLVTYTQTWPSKQWTNWRFFKANEALISHLFIWTSMNIHTLEVHSQSVGPLDIGGDDCSAPSSIVVSWLYPGICSPVCPIEYPTEENQYI